MIWIHRNKEEESTKCLKRLKSFFSPFTLAQRSWKEDFPAVFFSGKFCAEFDSSYVDQLRRHKCPREDGEILCDCLEQDFQLATDASLEDANLIDASQL